MALSMQRSDLVPFGDAVSGMYVLWNNWFGRNTKAFATSSEIQSRYVRLYSTRAKRQAPSYVHTCVCSQQPLERRTPTGDVMLGESGS